VLATARIPIEEKNRLTTFYLARNASIRRPPNVAYYYKLGIFQVVTYISNYNIYDSWVLTIWRHYWIWLYFRSMTKNISKELWAYLHLSEYPSLLLYPLQKLLPYIPSFTDAWYLLLNHFKQQLHYMLITDQLTTSLILCLWAPEA